ncbi:hypothetical protein E3W82_00555 [Listeria monocytogenes]|nr:hypothetical protein [Listeria monocytogenes]EAE5902804.1 hypothetical protein [Listeria monocytogenes]EHK9330044.1 hypothetical protein [Listeria monocytogenes]EIQ6425967.1 hypothetical protein [Listeria monocytogenes]EIQ6465968.1 hypothetical protein [Listeria monocytogenes]
MVKLVNADGSTLEGSAEELLEIIKGLSEDVSSTDEIRVLGDTYEKVANKAEEGDYIVFENSGVSYITPGRPYFVAGIDPFGDAIVIDNDDDEYDTDGDKFTVYRKKEVDTDSEDLNSANTALGEYFVVLSTGENFFDEGDLVFLVERHSWGNYAKFKRNSDGFAQTAAYSSLRRATSADYQANIRNN